MTIKKIFFDANIFNDIFDDKRATHQQSKEALMYALQNDIMVYTSCDIATNIYYITSKYTTKIKALDALEVLKDTVEIIPFGKNELSLAIELMRKDSDYTDMEDTIQYVLAEKMGCDLIVTNDKRFVAKEIECVGSDGFMEWVGSKKEYGV
ncbi:PIN domain-containing protein [bacterium]|nr:PIN domain-containing protein [bacterium]MBU1958810.1 PIN domain-containing protein [bacterium]